MLESINPAAYRIASCWKGEGSDYVFYRDAVALMPVTDRGAAWWETVMCLCQRGGSVGRTRCQTAPCDGSPSRGGTGACPHAGRGLYSRGRVIRPPSIAEGAPGIAEHCGRVTGGIRLLHDCPDACLGGADPGILTVRTD